MPMEIWRGREEAEEEEDWREWMAWRNIVMVANYFLIGTAFCICR